MGLTSGEAALLTSAVQVGFVVGAVTSDALTLSDVVRPKYLFSVSAFLGVAATVTLALYVESAVLAITLRFLTGVAFAGVYPRG